MSEKEPGCKVSSELAQATVSGGAAWARSALDHHVANVIGFNFQHKGLPRGDSVLVPAVMLSPVTPFSAYPAETSDSTSTTLVSSGSPRYPNTWTDAGELVTVSMC